MKAFYDWIRQLPILQNTPSSAMTTSEAIKTLNGVTANCITKHQYAAHLSVLFWLLTGEVYFYDLVAFGTQGKRIGRWTEMMKRYSFSWRAWSERLDGSQHRRRFQCNQRCNQLKQLGGAPHGDRDDIKSVCVQIGCQIWSLKISLLHVIETCMSAKLKKIL